MWKCGREGKEGEARKSGGEEGVCDVEGFGIFHDCCNEGNVYVYNSNGKQC